MPPPSLRSRALDGSILFGEPDADEVMDTTSAESVRQSSAGSGDVGQAVPWPTDAARAFNTVRATIANFIARMMKAVPEVERVYVRQERQENVFYSWIVIPDRNEEVMEKVYERQDLIIDRFSEGEFDFYIVYRGEQRPSKVVRGVLVFERA